MDIKKVLARSTEIKKLINLKQGTDEWINKRKESVGTSQMYQALNTDNSIRTIIGGKINCKKLGGYPIAFGNLFESTTAYICESKLNIKILECPGSVKSPKYPYITNSSDGLSVCKFHKELTFAIKSKLDLIDKLYKELNLIETEIKQTKESEELDLAMKMFYKKKLKKIMPTGKYKDYTRIKNLDKVNTSNKSDVEFITLFEFKSAYSRKLTNNIKQEYCYQVLAGMDCIPLTQIGIFYETVIKICKRQDLGFNNEYCDQLTYGKTPIEKLTNIPEIIGVKYVKIIGCNDPIKTECNYGNICIGKEGVDYISYEAPFFIKSDIIKLKYGNIISKELSDLLDILDGMEITEKTILMFYDRLDDIMINLGYSNIYNWKLFDDGMFWFPKYRNILDCWAEGCKYIIDKVKDIESSDIKEEDELKEYLKSVKKPN